MYLVNLQTDGDGIYHVHKSACPYRPRSDYKYLSSTNLINAISEAKRIVNSNRVNGCSHCC